VRGGGDVKGRGGNKGVTIQVLKFFSDRIVFVR
jgi:hypothetical protein